MPSSTLDTASPHFGRPAVHRPIRSILFVGSDYDAYILKEAGLVPQSDGRPWGGHPTWGEHPRHRASFVHVRTRAQAMERLGSGGVDLLLCDLKLEDGDGFQLGEEVRSTYPALPIIAMTSKSEYGRSAPLVPGREHLDRLFIWQGHPALMQAIVSSTEDAINLDFDVRQNNLRFILLVEDESTFFSRFLPLIYGEIEAMTRALLPPNLSPAERDRRMRERARVILVERYEDAIAPLDRYTENVLGVISDIQYPRGGRIDPKAGLSLVAHVKSLDADIPVIIQSRDVELREQAERAGAAFISKQSAHLLETLRRHLRLYFGFGDFVFRDPQTYQEVARAGTLEELLQVTPNIPLESFIYHGRRNHFSNWLYVHGAHDLADELQPIIGDDETVRAEMLDIIGRYV